MVFLRLRVAVVGEPTSGKTAFVQMVHSNGAVFPKNYLLTMGCDFVVKEFVMDEDNTVEVSLLDVAGQRLYDRMTAHYLESVSAFILVYDVSNKGTFESCRKWVTKARAVKKDIIGFLVANKVDLAEKAEVTDNQAEVFARANQLTFFKCSALRGTGTVEPVEKLARLFLEAYQKRLTQLSQVSASS
ncbi:ADP-ribosylation factor family/Ras of Complex, Roc, domain of DAPkinase/Ras family/Gtr1/RagA G protein conserved region containing protein, putative [Leishmania lindenbergi]|uniref:ADP-ribosylation factor family/Ras of Complex, Roc, domain of DAPkinase/Ras family n=1 Tax=Leishmania lindenbergi TaxID=651832 RepID=A0AAW3A3S1_9TRYP